MSAKPESTEAIMGRINRALPFSDEAERGVISCILNDPQNRLEEAREKLPVDAFYHTQSAAIYGLLLDMGQAGKAIDPITVTAFARDAGELDRMGGAAAISEYYAFAPGLAQFRDYCAILREKRVLRLMIGACVRCVEAAQLLQDEHGEQTDAEAILDTLQRDALAISVQREERGPEHISQAAQSVMDATDAAMESVRRGECITGMELGFCANVDRVLNGVEAGDRLVIGAHSTTGKTALLMNIATHLGRKYQAPGLIISLDGMNVTLARRAMAEISDVNITEIQTGVGLFEKDHSKIHALHGAQKILGGLPIWLDDRAGQSIQQVIATMRRMKKQHGLQWCAVDFFQKLSCPSRKNDFNEVRELKEVSNLWMKAVLDLGIVGIMLAQLNREVGRDGRPTQHNIKNCAALFEDASKTILLSNEERTLEDLRAKEEAIPVKDRQQAPALQLGEKLILAKIEKNKDGSTPEIWVRFWAPRMRFRSLVPGKKIYSAQFNKEARHAAGKA